MTDQLTRLREATGARDQAQQAWLRALTEARKHGATWGQLAAATGLTRAGARYLVTREPRT